ncbi:TldD/PmbA family protein [Kordiimonas pumila]|uniref:TldD/PmbA family protein n=1 Tax=Kordiimonas pumila TaxID=2161677 RepID=A0ABV7D754_9PROT|nr:TldD/PmbA family protein [Kordiimonas pumila]
MPQRTLETLHDLVNAAQKAGADAADAVAVDARSRGVSWRNGQMEDVEGSEGEDIGLRVMFGQKQAMVSTSDRRPANLKELVERTVAMARAVPEDEYCGLAPKEALAHGPFPDLDLYDDTDISADQLKELAQIAEDAVYSVKGVTNSGGAGASAGSYAISLITSHGFEGHYQGSSFSISATAVAGTGTAMERDYDYTSKRHFADMANAADIGKKAGDLAVGRLNPAKAKSGRMPLVFAPRVANSLLGHFVGAISGTAVARGTSFLKDKMGKPVFNPAITVTDDPLIKRGISSKVFDGEGVAVSRQNLVENGVLKSWILNSASARQLGLAVTGHASRGTSSAPGISTTNLYIAPGDLSPSALMADIKEGIYITDLIGMGVNGVTGDYSRGAAGFMIRDGVIAEAVSEFTIAGNLKEMFMELQVSSDLVMQYGTNAPTSRIDGMMVAGA